ncbi:MAG: hypothetical protein M9944_12830 [Rhizobiaceae bacterium]|nr:hypothetical protein [Rhizobiaceae bacterium]
MTDKIEVVIVNESLATSLAKDAGTLVVLVSMAGIGVLLESTALQWVGAILGFIWLLSRATSAFSKSRMTIAQARKRLDEIEAASKEALN